MTNGEWLESNGIPSDYHDLKFMMNTVTNNPGNIEEYGVVEIQLDGMSIDYMYTNEFKNGVFRGQWLNKERECKAKLNPMEQAFLISLWKLTYFKYIYSVLVKTNRDGITELRIKMISGKEFSVDTRYLDKTLRFIGLGDEQYHWTPYELGICKWRE